MSPAGERTILSRYLAMKTARARRLTRLVFCFATASFLGACQAPGNGVAPKATGPQTLIVQPGDVPGFQRCGTSGDVKAVLSDEKNRRSPAYDLNATEWEQWRRQGAVDAYFAVYGQTAADCAAVVDSSGGAPPGQLLVGIVVQFQDARDAASNFHRDSTLMGLGPKDVRFIELAGGTTTFGSETGLGSDSVVGSAEVAGAHYFVAQWQNRSFESDFIGYDMAFDDARHAVMDVNRRILQA